MKKSSLFFSATITTFILAVIAGVIKARANDNPVVTDTPISTNTLVQATDTVTPSIAGATISPQEASVIAAFVLGSSDLYSVETANLYGMDVYKVTFSSGNIVYVSPLGHVLEVTFLRRYVTAPAPKQGQSSGNQPQNQPASTQPPVPTTAHHSDDGGDD
jgi:hypothetical protein